MQTMMYCIGDLTVITPAMLAEMRSLGVTIVKNGHYASNAYDSDSLNGWLDACHSAGVKTIIDLVKHTYRAASRNLSIVDSVITICDSHPACYGYYTDDESDGDAYTIAERQTVYDYIKARTTKPVMEVHYRVDPVPDKAAHYSDAVHDIYGIDYYIYDLFGGNATNWQAYIDGEYAKLTAKDKASLTHVLQAYGQSAGTTPPANNLETMQYPRTLSPNNWQTWGVSFYTYRRKSSPGLDSDLWNTPVTVGYEYLKQDIQDVNTDYLPAPTISVTGQSRTGDTYTLTGTCAAGCYVKCGSIVATVNEAGTGWTCDVPTAGGIVNVVASNGLASVSTTVTLDETAAHITVNSTVNIETQPVLTGSESGSYLRVFDGAATRYVTLVETSDSTASAVRFFDGTQTWAVQSEQADTVPTAPSVPGGKKSNFAGFKLTWKF